MKPIHIILFLGKFAASISQVSCHYISILICIYIEKLYFYSKPIAILCGPLSSSTLHEMDMPTRGMIVNLCKQYQTQLQVEFEKLCEARKNRRALNTLVCARSKLSSLLSYFRVSLDFCGQYIIFYTKRNSHATRFSTRQKITLNRLLFFDLIPIQA